MLLFIILNSHIFANGQMCVLTEPFEKTEY